MPEIVVSLLLGNEAEKDLKKLEKKVVDKLFANFIKPLLLGYAKDHLEGKYKPSWELPTSDRSPFRNAFARSYRENNLYHYHFGYPIYIEGKDPNYPGKVSDGIVHTVYQESNSSAAMKQCHKIFHIDLTHPSPFKVPNTFNQKYSRF
jgi:hypothetical protein